MTPSLEERIRPAYHEAMSLPARVRVTCPPLPLAPALARAVARLCPAAPAEVQAAALAIAGGAVIGALVRWNGNGGPAEAQQIETGWRGKGIEQALAQALSGQALSGADKL